MHPHLLHRQSMLMAEPSAFSHIICRTDKRLEKPWYGRVRLANKNFQTPHYADPRTTAKAVDRCGLPPVLQQLSIGRREESRGLCALASAQAAVEGWEAYKLSSLARARRGAGCADY